jgi:hypothetical protein
MVESHVHTLSICRDMITHLQRAAFCDSGSSSKSSGGGGSDGQASVRSSVERTALYVDTLHVYRFRDSVYIY